MQYALGYSIYGREIGNENSTFFFHVELLRLRIEPGNTAVDAGENSIHEGSPLGVLALVRARMNCSEFEKHLGQGTRARKARPKAESLCAGRGEN